MTFDDFLKDMDEIGKKPPEAEVKCDYKKCWDYGKWMRCYFHPEFTRCDKYNLGIGVVENGK